ncbi:MAG: glycosyltransferase family 4 protein [Bacillota bacterium]|nr:glycosyltransferase family 4 protein [Bacillota bacterium]
MIHFFKTIAAIGGLSLHMKILLSAYACEPNKGSEPAVGWNWMLSLCREGHAVFLLTRRNNATAIEAERERQNIPVTPLYYDLPSWCRRWKRLPGGLFVYYLLWQLGAYFYARKMHRIYKFDLVHHVTFVTFRQPSFMGWLGIPFILGPVGGGETSPLPLRTGLSRKGRILERLRDLAIFWARIDPLMHLTFSRAVLIACTTQETRQHVPRRYHHKCIILPAIGITVQESTLPSQPSRKSFLFIGRLLYWKGIHLALRAFPDVLRQVPDARLRIIGEGEDSAWLKNIASQYGISSLIDWLPWQPHENIAREYADNIAFVFPSLHDSGGLVVLESLAASLPVICLDLGGPGTFVDDTCGIVIQTAGQDDSLVQKALASAMVRLATDSGLRNSLVAHCRERAGRFTWDENVRTLYSFYRTIQKT